MKKLTLFFLLAFQFYGKSQVITSIDMVPAAPDDNDTITFYINMEFNSGSCAGSSSGASILGNTVYASGEHCMGMLTFICHDTDTVKIAPQPAGNYQFVYVLSAGMGGPPCSPPLVANDTDTLAFTITSTVGIKENIADDQLVVSPNPSSGWVLLEWKGDTRITRINVLDEMGRMVQSADMRRSMQLDLKPGIYFVRLPEAGISRKLVVTQ